VIDLSFYYYHDDYIFLLPRRFTSSGHASDSICTQELGRWVLTSGIYIKSTASLRRRMISLHTSNFRKCLEKMGEFSFVKLEWHQPVALEHYSIVIYIALKPNANRLPIACNGTAKQQKLQTKVATQPHKTLMVGVSNVQSLKNNNAKTEDSCHTPLLANSRAKFSTH